MNDLEKSIKEISLAGVSGSAEDRTHRIAAIVSLPSFPGGNLVEIGAGYGHTTKHLLKTGRKVLVIDPWQSEINGYGVYPYQEFAANVAGFKNLTVAKIPSYYKDVEGYLRDAAPIAFAFVDGEQLKETVISDLFLMSAFNVQVICVDDVNRETRNSQVPAALEKFLTGNNLYSRIETRKGLMEGYLIRKK